MPAMDSIGERAKQQIDAAVAQLEQRMASDGHSPELMAEALTMKALCGDLNDTVFRLLRELSGILVGEPNLACWVAVRVLADLHTRQARQRMPSPECIYAGAERAIVLVTGILTDAMDAVVNQMREERGQEKETDLVMAKLASAAVRQQRVRLIMETEERGRSEETGRLSMASGTDGPRVLLEQGNDEGLLIPVEAIMAVEVLEATK